MISCKPDNWLVVRAPVDHCCWCIRGLRPTKTMVTSLTRGRDQREAASGGTKLDRLGREGQIRTCHTCDSVPKWLKKGWWLPNRAGGMSLMGERLSFDGKNVFLSACRKGNSPSDCLFSSSRALRKLIGAVKWRSLCARKDLNVFSAGKTSPSCHNGAEKCQLAWTNLILN